MKVKTFKKVIATLASLAMTASAFAGLSISASAAVGDVLYSQDFEGVALTDLTYTLAGNTTAQMLTDKAGNATTFFDYYVSGASGNRASTLTLPNTYGKGVPVEFSMKMRMMGSNTNPSEFQVRDSAGKAILSMTANSYVGSPAINGTSVTLTTGNIGAVLGVSNYATTGWLEFSGVIDFSKSPAVVDLTVTDTTNGNAVVYSDKYSTEAADIKTIYGSIGRSNGAFAFDDILIKETQVQGVSYKVTYNVDGTESTEFVDEGSYIASVPETTKIGYIFKGWNKDSDTATLYSTADIQAMAISAETAFTAVFEKDTSYIEPITSIVISGPDKMTFGPNPDTAADNAYSVKLTGEAGTDMTAATIDSRVTDFNVEWDIEGFKTENDTEGQYCDSYGAFTVNNSTANDTVFALRNVPMNFYGKMTATITYNGETFTASKYVVALGNTTTDNILPVAGYPSDYDEYDDAFVGYASAKDTYGNVKDLILGEWNMSGSDPNGSAVIMNENGNKFVRVTSATGSKSHMFTKTIEAPQSQVIFTQDVRFNSNGGIITLTSKYPFYGNGYTCPVTLRYSGGAVTLNGASVVDSNDNTAAITAGTWYKVVLSVDKTTQTCFVKIYDTNGNYVGGADNVAWTEESNPTYYSIGMDNKLIGTIDFDNYSAKYATADTATYSLTASQDTLSIPKGDTADLVASLKTTEGYDITGAATWTVLEEDMQEGVIITPDATDSHKATVTLADGAEAGEATVQVSIAGYTKTITLNITSSAESVKFTKSNTSVSIPLDDTATTAEYEAVVIDGDGNDLGRDVTYAVYDKNNTAEYTFPEGITFNNGVLTVEKTALPCTFTIRATGKNTDGNDISKAVKVTVHGLAFDFGTTDDDAIAEGYTPVGTDTAYTDARGYGVVGTPVAGGSASTEDADTDYLDGAFEFDAKVTPGKMYTVEVTYQGSIVNAYVSPDLAGYTLGSFKEMTTATYTVASVSDIMDLRFVNYTYQVTGADTPNDTSDDKYETTTPKVSSVKITKNADRTPRTKPVLHHVGDSTAANNGSWAYHIDHNRSSFPELDALVTFANNGAGGRNLCTYYTQGKLQGVLNDIYPGDIVMFGNNGTNGMGSSFEADVNYYLDAAEAMGAKIIINSYTPHGAVGAYAGCYDSATNTFNGYRQDSYDVIVRKVAEERAKTDANYLGFVEIGKNADAAFNAYVADYANNGYASADAAAQAIIKCFSDHNHYSDGSIARTLMLDGYGDVKGVVEQLVTILTATPKITCDQIIATYENGVVTGVTINRGVEVEDATMSVVTDNGVTTKTMYWTTVEEMEIAK